MKRSLLLLCVGAVGAGLLAAHAGEPDLEKLRSQPIAVGGGKVDVLLRQWWKERAAAGNAGDFYDNRDGDHSPLSLAPFPQMSAIKYSAADIAARKHWAAQHTLLPHVTFGNSSTSAPAHLGGSNPRSYYVNASRLNFLYKQYTGNNLYIYPEHRDHDPGHNGRNDGYGDMYPTNTPYLIISQGSSGSDQPFMRMMPHVLAAFRPEVKKKLTETGLLMPTIQMLMRSTYKEVKEPKDYLTAKAHPTVFEGSRIDELAMVQRAHELDVKTLPPMVQLRVIDEDKAVNGIDYIDSHASEVLGDTPGCIARIHRSKAYKQRLVVNADASYDVNKLPLTYKWVVLRGDPSKITIVPRKDDHSVAEITVAYHDRRPIAPGSPMESNRVDIGVFVHNGVHYSAPAFVTIHTLDREARVYNRDGKLLSIAHGMGETELRVTNWENLCKHIGKDAVAGKLMQLTPDQVLFFSLFGRGLADAAEQIAEQQTLVKQGEAVLQAATEPADKEKAKKNLELYRLQVTKMQKEFNASLDAKHGELGESVRSFVESRLMKLTRDPLFTQTHADWIKEQRTAVNDPRIKSAWDKLRRFGIAGEREWLLLPLLPGKTLADSTWTPFERAHLEWLHATLLAELAFPGMVQVEWRTNHVDQRLSAPREWRDVSRHDPNGLWIGWRRYSAEGSQVFNHEGLLAVELDPPGRVVKARVVRYEQAPFTEKGINTNPLRLVLADDTIVRYDFADKNDWLGRRAGTEPAKSEKKK